MKTREFNYDFGEEGEKGSSFFILVEGQMEVRKADLYLARLKPGACFGEISYLSSQPRSASVIATSACSVLRVNAQLLQGASQRCQLAFQDVFIRTLIERLVATTRTLAGRD